MTYTQVWWPILRIRAWMSFICHIHNRSEMCSLHLTHPSVHTWSSGQTTVQRPGSSRGLPVGAGIRTHNLGLHRVSSPTLYPLGQRLPAFALHLTHPKCTHTAVNTHTVNTYPEQWAAIYAAVPREHLGVRSLTQGHLSHGIKGGESAGHSFPPPTIPARPETRTRVQCSKN